MPNNDGSHLILLLQAEVAEVVELLVGAALHQQPQVVLEARVRLGDTFH
jgi:hypothetical protein